MKQAGYPKRSYSRSSERPRQSQTKQTNVSSVEGKMRGNPQQFVEKYLTLARDAASLGDPISAENYYQYADHYYRLVAASRPSRSPYAGKKIVETEDEPQAPNQPKFIEEKHVAAPVPTQSGNWLE
jgi:hypothetical protein